jgi:hypothetical protein
MDNHYNALAFLEKVIIMLSLLSWKLSYLTWLQTMTVTGVTKLPTLEITSGNPEIFFNCLGLLRFFITILSIN